MGYDTEFFGSVTVEPPLNKEEIEYLNAFAETRHMMRKESPYHVDPNSNVILDFKNDNIIDYNTPPEGQPGLWCQWVPLVTERDEEGNPVSANAIVWDGGEKFYNAAEWMQYIIDHFIGSDPIAKKVEPEKFSFLQGHVVNGEIEAQGEDYDDRWLLVVDNNQVSVKYGKVVYE